MLLPDAISMREICGRAKCHFLVTLFGSGYAGLMRGGCQGTAGAAGRLGKFARFSFISSMLVRAIDLTTPHWVMRTCKDDAAWKELAAFDSKAGW
jgi:hypothetical protein